MRLESNPNSYYRIVPPTERTPALLGKQCGGGVFLSLGCEVVEIDAAAMLADMLIEKHTRTQGPVKSQGATRPNNSSFSTGSHPGYRKKST